jgi:PAS domain S-box-containing protein
MRAKRKGTKPAKATRAITADFRQATDPAQPLATTRELINDLTRHGEHAEEERRALTEQLQTELRVVRRLQEVSSLQIQIANRTPFYEQIVEAATYIMQSDMASMQKFDPERGELHLLVSKGFHPQSAKLWEIVHLGSNTSCSVALREGKRCIIADTEKSDLLAGTSDLEEFRRSGIRAMQSTPLASRSGRLLGMITTHWREPHVPQAHTLQQLDVLARQAADLFERSLAEEALRESEEKLRLFIEHAPASLAMFDREMRYIALSRRWKADYRLGDQDVVGRSHYEVFPEIPDRWKEVHQRGLQGEVLSAREDCFLRADGNVHWEQWEVRPWRKADGAIGGIVIFSEDITSRKQAEEARRATQDRLRTTLNAAYDAIISINQQGVIQSVNPATEQLFGYAAAEMEGQNVSLLMPSPYCEEHDGFLRRYLETGEAHIIGIGREVQARRKDGSLFPVDLSVSEVDRGQLFTGMIRDATARKNLEREVVEIASREQRRIGSDLHDSVGQELTALNMLAKDLMDSIEDPSLSAKLAARMTEGLQRCQLDLRTVLRGLLPVPVDREGLMAALADLASRTQQEGKVACVFECRDPVEVVDNLIATHLYYIAQEAVHNAVKHGQAKQVCIALETADHNVMLRVQDDGIGMPARFPERRGLGLRIMSNRATIIGARLTIEPAQPRGTVVKCIWLRTNNVRSEK